MKPKLPEMNERSDYDDVSLAAEKKFFDDAAESLLTLPSEHDCNENIEQEKSHTGNDGNEMKEEQNVQTHDFTTTKESVSQDNATFSSESYMNETEDTEMSFEPIQLQSSKDEDDVRVLSPAHQKISYQQAALDDDDFDYIMDREADLESGVSAVLRKNPLSIINQPIVMALLSFFGAFVVVVIVTLSGSFAKFGDVKVITTSLTSSFQTNSPSMQLVSAYSVAPSTCEYVNLRDFLEKELDYNPTLRDEEDLAPSVKAYVWMSSLNAIDRQICKLSDTAEKYLLAVLYFSLNGEAWFSQMNFLSEKHICTWNSLSDGVHMGAFCDGSSGDSITTIHITNNKLKGTIPKEITKLKNLKEFYLSGEEIVGTIPSEMSRLTSLQSLNLIMCGITGSIPSELGILPNIKTLYLSDNYITGTIPPAIGNLKSLTHFGADGNILSGSLPSEIGTLVALEELYLFFNSLTGNLPTELGNLKELTNIKFDFNNFVGVLPSQVGQLSKLEAFHFSENGLINGHLPTEIGSLSNLRTLSLYSNKLSGTLPSEIGNLKKLEELKLFKNRISGTIPTDFSHLRSLQHFHVLWGNNITGDIEFLCGIKSMYITIMCEVEKTKCACCKCWQP